MDQYEKNFDESIDSNDAVDNVPMNMGQNSFMEQIEREISKIMKEESFLNEKS